MKHWRILIALLVAGCGADAEEPGSLQSIGYATLACYGTCPVYQATIHPDGTGVYFGENHVRVTGHRRFRISPGHGAPWRPGWRPIARPA